MTPALSSTLADGSPCRLSWSDRVPEMVATSGSSLKMPISASLARKLGSHLLTETMERRPEVGFGSYDRLFPNQDTLPKGGFGNLIALPLQKRARQWGNTVFIDEQFKPYADQWSILAALRRVGRAQVEALVRDAEAKGRVIGVPMSWGRRG